MLAPTRSPPGEPRPTSTTQPVGEPPMSRLKKAGPQLDGPNTPQWRFAWASPVKSSDVKPVIDYDQAKDARLEKLPSLQGGACLALSIFWVQNSRQGVELVTWLKPPKAACSQGIDQLSYEITHGGEGLQWVMNAQKKM